MSPVKYKLCFYIPEDDILHSHRRENLNCYLDMLPSSELWCRVVRITERYGRVVCLLAVPVQFSAIHHSVRNRRIALYLTHVKTEVYRNPLR
jgi:hypothetical protein